MRSLLCPAMLAFALAGCPPGGTKAGAAGDAAVDAKTAIAPAGTAEAGADGGADDAVLPPSSSPELTARAKHLLEAIAHDDPGLATDIVFPRDAYLLAKDAADPGKQWDTKVITAFTRQIHAMHRHTKGIERAQFVTFDLGEPVVQAVPKKRDLKRSLWRVRHSRLTYTIDGKAQHIDLAEMLSWRGAWYVTRIRGTVK